MAPKTIIAAPITAASPKRKKSIVHLQMNGMQQIGDEYENN